MENIRLYHNYINEPGYNDKQRTASDKHNLRLDDDNPNVIHSLTKNNILVVNGKRMKPTDTQEAGAEVKATCEALKKDFITNANTNSDEVKLSDTRKARLQEQRTKFKAKVKKWRDNPKADPNEKDFWSEIYENLGNEKLDTDKLSNDLKELDPKVKRFKDKLKAIDGAKDFNELIGTSSRNLTMTTITKELLYKIPDQYEKDIKPIDFFNICRKVNCHLYPNHKAIYETVHCDENKDNAHFHCRLNGKNNKTGQFDIQTALLNRISELNPELGLKGRKYSSLNEDELKAFGEAYQSEIFKTFNKHLNDKKYDFTVKKRTKAEKEADAREFFDKKRPIAEREYNAQTKLKEENKSLSAEKDSLSLEKIGLTEEVDKLTNEKSKLLSFIQNTKKFWRKEFPKFVDSLFKFDKHKNKNDLEEAAERGNSLKDNNKSAFDYAEKHLSKELSKDTPKQLENEMTEQKKKKQSRGMKNR